MGIRQRQRAIDKCVLDMQQEESDMQRLKAAGVDIPKAMVEQHEQDQARRQALIDKHTAAIESTREANRIASRTRVRRQAAIAARARVTPAEDLSKSLQLQYAATRARKRASTLRSRVSRYSELSSTNPVYYDWQIQRAREELADLTHVWGEDLLNDD